MIIFLNHLFSTKNFLKLQKKKNYMVFDSSDNNNLLEKKILGVTLNQLKKK